MMMTCGFLFSPSRQTVLLVEKKKPEWQAGQLNGIGGKVEPGETVEQAMDREWNEEGNHGQGFPIFPKWEPFAIVSVPEKSVAVTFYRAFAENDHVLLRRAGCWTDVGEEMVIVNVRDLGHRNVFVIPNLRWLIPAALDTDLCAPLAAVMKAT